MCSQSTPSGSDELSGGTFRGPPPSGLKPCVPPFLLSSLTVVASVFCLPSSCFSEWYGLVSADRFLHSPKTICRLTSLRVFLEQAASVILSMVPVGLCCTGLDWIGRRVCVCVGAWISAGQKSSFMIELEFLSSCQWCVLFSGDTSVGTIEIKLFSSNQNTLNWTGLVYNDDECDSLSSIEVREWQIGWDEERKGWMLQWGCINVYASNDREMCGGRLGGV